MTKVLLIGTDTALLEGIAQSLGREGHRPVVAQSFAEAREIAATSVPLVVIADRAMACASGAELLSVPIGAGGARLLYRASSGQHDALAPSIQRSVLADLTLPLERFRLLALVKSIGDRAVSTGRLSPSFSAEINPDA